MSAKELREMQRTIREHGLCGADFDGREEEIILSALSLAAAVEESGEEVVRELLRIADAITSRPVIGHWPHMMADKDHAMAKKAAALLVARSAEIERFKELDRLAEALANWVRALSNNVGTRKLLSDYEAYRAAKGAP